MIPGADDSKVLSRPERERLFVEIKKVALAWAWGTVHSPTIDRINILRASRLAMRRALGKLLPSPDLVVVDGWTIPRLEFDQVALPKADGLSLSVACASILAKVRRDRIMIRWGKRYPEYHFAGNKGYATLRHLEALDRFGPCPLHRRSFAPVAQLRLPLVMT
jgi:ribonuclease HII